VEVALLIAQLQILMAVVVMVVEATVLIETLMQSQEQQILAVVAAVVELQAASAKHLPLEVRGQLF
jgi:hypothetical protein